MLKNNKGITLIALVITIIVLLILAGVSIAMLTGENGILTQAENSKEDTAMAEAADKINMALNGEFANLLADGEFTGTKDELLANNGLDVPDGEAAEYKITAPTEELNPTTNGIVLTIASTKYEKVKGSISYNSTSKDYTITRAKYPVELREADEGAGD